MKKLSNALKIEAMERLKKGQTPSQIAASLEVQLWQVEDLDLQYWKQKLEASQAHVNSLKGIIAKHERMTEENKELKTEIARLKAQIESMKPAIDSVNSLTAERSKLIRKLKRAGIKI